METEELSVKEKVSLFLANPSEENFDILDNDVLCLSIVYQKLSDKTILTNFYTKFEQIEDVYIGHFAGEMKTDIVKRFLSLASSIDDYDTLYYHADESILKQNIYDKIDVFELPVEEWIKLYHQTNDKKRQKLFKKKICDLIKDLDGWITICEFYKEKDYSKRFMKFLAKNLIKVFDNHEDGKKVFEWIKYYFRSDKLIIVYFQKMYDLSNTLEEYLFVYSFISDFWDFKKSVKDDRALIRLNSYQKVISMAKTFEDWDEIYLSIYNVSDEEHMEALAIQKMTELL